jgi:hypothetical protein
MLLLARTGLSLVILLVLAGALSLAVLFPSRPPSTTSVVASPELTIRADQIERSSDNMHTHVGLQVTAGATDEHDLSVFWAVSLEDENSTPDPLYIAPAKTLDTLTAGSTVELDWPEATVVLPPGDYQLTGWAHQAVASADPRNVAGGRIGQLHVVDAIPTNVELVGDGFAPPLGSLALESLTIDQVAPEKQQLAIHMTVSNRGNAPTGGRAYWVVGRLPDSEAFMAPWWQAHWQVLPTLQPGASASVDWLEPLDVPGGTYGLSAWVHAGGAADWEHSDNSFPIPLLLAPNMSGIQRAGPPNGAVRIVSAAVANGSAQLRIQNDGPPERVSVGVVGVSELRGFDWYRDTPPPPSHSASLDSGAQTLPVSGASDCSDGHRYTRVTLYAPDASMLDDVLVDTCPP